jgi:RNA-directed DNA polymerase
MAISPIAEVWADPNSYGFRPKRSVAAAIEQTFIALSRRHSTQWIFEGDIKAFFDRLSQDWIVDNIPMNKCILSKFLKAGFMEKKRVSPTEQGAPQGGTISPTLTLMALSGLERLIKENFKKKNKVNVVVYCDDFIITCTSKERIEQEIIPLIKDFLNHRGLEI